jgi:hypothetical protein
MDTMAGMLGRQFPEVEWRLAGRHTVTARHDPVAPQEL